MEKSELVTALRRLCDVGFGYDLTVEDKTALRQAADEIQVLALIDDLERGKDVLVGVDINGTGEFEAIATLRASRVNLSAAKEDVTNADAQEGWRDWLSGAG